LDHSCIRTVRRKFIVKPHAVAECARPRQPSAAGWPLSDRKMNISDIWESRCRGRTLARSDLTVDLGGSMYGGPCGVAQHPPHRIEQLPPQARWSNSVKAGAAIALNTSP